MRRLDALVAAPALLPPLGSTSYAEVLEAERWGDEVFQSVPRRILDAAFMRVPGAMESYAADAKLPLPMGAAAPGDAADRPADGDRNTGRAMTPREPTCPRSRASSTSSTAGSRTPARRAAAQRRRPADRQRDPPASEHRRRTAADRGAPGRRARRATSRHGRADRRRRPAHRVALDRCRPAQLRVAQPLTLSRGACG